jgi:hypothetical protein
MSPSHSAFLARTHDEGASRRCVEEEDAARGVEGRRDVCGISGSVHYWYFLTMGFTYSKSIASLCSSGSPSVDSQAAT